MCFTLLIHPVKRLIRLIGSALRRFRDVLNVIVIRLRFVCYVNLAVNLWMGSVNAVMGINFLRVSVLSNY